MARKAANFKVVWAEAAETDLQEIFDYLVDTSPSGALSAVERVERAAAALKRMPERGRHVPELAGSDIHTHRELISLPWRIIYRISGSTVEVIAVLDGRRNLRKLLFERLLK